MNNMSKGVGVVAKGGAGQAPAKPVKADVMPKKRLTLANPPSFKPMARPARLKRRHRGLVMSFVLAVLLPLSAVVYYLWNVAEDQYSSVSGFTVRQEEDGGSTELLGGIAQLAGSSVSSDGDILYEFILSQSLVRAVDAMVDLRGHYSARWDTDPIFALWPDASIEDLEWFWKRVVRISYDQGSGLTEVRVLAFDPKMAQDIGNAIISQSQDMINALNEQAREDAMGYATADLDEAVARLKVAREGLTAFRIRTQIVDPEADLRGRMGVLNNLQQQLAEALIELDILVETTSQTDPRLVQTRRKIDVIRARIADERKSFATETNTSSPGGEDYPSLMAEYEGLEVDREFAEESYRAALTALDIARAKASRQSRYLATYVTPTRAETSEYPRHWVLTGVTALFLLLGWSVLVLVFYSIRDRQ